MAAPVQMTSTGQSPEDPSRAIHLRDLPKSITEAQLREALTAFGAIQSVRIESIKDTSHGSVQFDSTEAAEKAVAQGSLQLLESRVQIERFMPRKPGSVYVRGFDTSFTEQQLKAVFGVFGEISSCAINRDQQAVSRGFGFVNFVQAESAERALSLNGQTQEGITWYVSPVVNQGPAHSHRNQPEDWTRRNVYIAGFPAYVSQGNIQALCQSFGEIESIRMQVKQDEPEQGAAFVCFKREQDADNAIKSLRSTLIERCRIQVTKWKPIESRKANTLPRSLLTQWPFAPPYGYFPMPFQPRPQHTHQPRRHQAPAKPQPQPPQPTPVSQFDLQKYHSLSPNDRKRYIGEFIFFQLRNQYRDSTGKITGMLLEMQEKELLALVQDAEALQAKGNEAMEVLKRHTQAHS